MTGVLDNLKANFKCKCTLEKSMLWHRQHLTHTLCMPSWLETPSRCMEEAGTEQYVSAASNGRAVHWGLPELHPRLRQVQKNQNAAAFSGSIRVLRLRFAAKLPFIDQGSYRIQSALKAELSQKHKILYILYCFCQHTIWQLQAYYPWEYYTTVQRKIAFPCSGTKINLLKK